MAAGLARSRGRRGGGFIGATWRLGVRAQGERGAGRGRTRAPPRVRFEPEVGDAPDGRTPRVRERGGRTGVGLGRGSWAARGDSARGRKKKMKERLGWFGLRGKEEKERERLGWAGKRERGRKVFHFPLKT